MNRAAVVVALALILVLALVLVVRAGLGDSDGDSIERNAQRTTTTVNVVTMTSTAFAIINFGPEIVPDSMTPMQGRCSAGEDSPWDEPTVQWTLNGEAQESRIVDRRGRVRGDVCVLGVSYLWRGAPLDAADTVTLTVLAETYTLTGEQFMSGSTLDQTGESDPHIIVVANHDSDG